MEFLEEAASVAKASIGILILITGPSLAPEQEAVGWNLLVLASTLASG